MTKHRRTYTREFKLEAIELWQTSGKSAQVIEDNLGIARGLLYHWKGQLHTKGEDAFPGHGRMAPAEEEIRRLRRELEIVKQERDILKKAVGIFSRQK